MSVNVGQRNVPDTPSNRQLEACQAAMDLAVHTIKITSNTNIFKVEYQGAVTNEVISTAKTVYTSAWSANNVYVSKVKPDRWPEREKLQYEAINKCNELLALINIARRVFHLKSTKVNYWSQLALNARRLITKWHEANAEQYRGVGYSAECPAPECESRQCE